jgi:hypothetical protein
VLEAAGFRRWFGGRGDVRRIRLCASIEFINNVTILVAGETFGIRAQLFVFEGTGASDRSKFFFGKATEEPQTDFRFSRRSGRSMEGSARLGQQH